MDISRTFARTLLLALLLLAGLAWVLPCRPALAADAGNVGHVSRIKGLAYAAKGAALHELAPGVAVHRADVLKTGPGARLEVTMLDETVLTLGADSEFVIERYDLGGADAAVLLRLAKGAFRIATGKLAALREGPFEVGTPLGVIGIRGTDFWGGFLAEGQLSVLLISGKGVYVRTVGGRSEILRPLEGVTLGSASAPPPAPSLWSPDKRARAFKTVSFE